MLRDFRGEELQQCHKISHTKSEPSFRMESIKISCLFIELQLLLHQSDNHLVLQGNAEDVIKAVNL